MAKVQIACGRGAKRVRISSPLPPPGQAGKAFPMSARPYTPKNHTLSGLYCGPETPDRLAIFLHGYGANGAD